MRQMMTRFLVVMMLGVMSGCALWSSPPAAARAPATGEARVFVYRMPLISGQFWDTTVGIDGRAHVDVNDKEYAPLYLPAGSHVFTARFYRQKPLQVRQDLQAGHTYYLELSQEIVSKNRVRPVMQFVPEHNGKAFLNAL